MPNRHHRVYLRDCPRINQLWPWLACYRTSGIHFTQLQSSYFSTVASERAWVCQMTSQRLITKNAAVAQLPSATHSEKTQLQLLALARVTLPSGLPNILIYSGCDTGQGL